VKNYRGTCADCNFSYRASPSSVDRQCRRFPPVSLFQGFAPKPGAIAVRGQAEMMAVVNSYFPAVAPHISCGEWELKIEDSEEV